MLDERFIFLASFVNKKSYWELSKLDYLFGMLALMGVVVWQVTGEGNLAILFAILADALAGVPTLIKSYFNPETENSLIFMLGIFNAAITLLTISNWSFAHWGFPVYILSFNIIISLLIKFKLGLVLQKKMAYKKT